jgi:ribosome recycling factor
MVEEDLSKALKKLARRVEKAAREVRVLLKKVRKELARRVEKAEKLPDKFISESLIKKAEAIAAAFLVEATAA